MIGVAKGYEKEVLPDGVVIYRIHGTDKITAETWFHDVTAVFAEAIRQGQPARLMYDVREVGFFTPHVMKRAGQLAQVPLPADWRVATLVKNAFVRQLVSTIKTISLLSQEMYERSHVFSDEAEALAWLRKETARTALT